MTDRVLPYACAVANLAIDALTECGQMHIAGSIAIVNRATCDLVHALHREHEATTPDEQRAAQRARAHAEARLRDGLAAGHDDDTQAAIDHLQALLARRRHHRGGVATAQSQPA